MRTAKTNAGKNAKKLDLSYIAGRNVKCYKSSGNNLAVSYKAKHNYHYDPAIAFLGMYPRQMKTYICTRYCT